MRRPLLSSTERRVQKSIDALANDSQVKRAFEFIDSSEERFSSEHAKICEIPAPPFKEEKRAQYFAARFTELGLADVHIDSEGNAIGFYRGQSPDPLVVFLAHLDTVFPESTDVRVRREGTRMYAPGIADNCAGLAALIGSIQALNAGQIATRGTIAFVATVGEEGEGNLRGVRHLFSEGRLQGRVSSFVSLDGPGLDYITHQALGSRRYRVRLEGPGGHSWADFGVVNPLHAMGRIAARLSEYNAPVAPRTTYNIGRLFGGDSVNVIPQRAEMDVDLRSASEDELQRLDDYLLSSINQAVTEENSQRAASGESLKVDVALIGNRPSGETSTRSLVVIAAQQVSRMFGVDPVLNRASTDANIPISLSIPAITIGAGGQFGDSHRLSEWYDSKGRDIGYKRVLLIALVLAGIVD